MFISSKTNFHLFIYRTFALKVQGDVNIKILPNGVNTYHNLPVGGMTMLDFCGDILQGYH